MTATPGNASSRHSDVVERLPGATAARGSLRTCWLVVYCAGWRRTTATAPADDIAATEPHDDAADESRLVRRLKVAGRAVLSFWLAAVSAWALGAALDVAGLDWNSVTDTVVLALFGAAMTAVYFRGLKPQPAIWITQQC